jgi:hypothetical protein
VQVWSDEFNGPAGAPVDTTNWHFDLGGACWGNNERVLHLGHVERPAERLRPAAIVARVAPAGLTCWYGACRYSIRRDHDQRQNVRGSGRIESAHQARGGAGAVARLLDAGQNIGSVGWQVR